MTGLAARPGTAVEPTCSITTASSPTTAAARSLELDRPRRAVVDDDDWIRHGARLVVHLIHPARTQPAQNRAARDTPGTVPDTPAADTSRAGPVWTGWV